MIMRGSILTRKNTIHSLKKEQDLQRNSNKTQTNILLD
jgi:hypothetical protein